MTNGNSRTNGNGRMNVNGRNPFPGLRAFEPEEDHLFFGREKETDELRRRLRAARFLAVIGSSGSGKSSLVKSGMIPSLHAGFMAGAGSSWRVVTLRPGEDPLGNLAKALQGSAVVAAMSGAASTKEMVLAVTLRDSSLGVAETVKHAQLPAGENVLVLVDQFEELFRFKRSRDVHHSDDEAVAFVKLLLDAARQDYVPVYVALTMRSEFIGECMPFPGLPEAINRGQYLIPRMTRDDLRAAITKPVAVSGATIAPRLVVRLLNEVGDETDHLPVLQHALMRTWDAWALDHAGGEPVDVRHYEAIGTMKSALSQHAEEAYDDLKSERARAIAERLFKTITETTEEGRGVRRPTRLDRIAAVCNAAEAEVAGVVETFRQTGRAFLQPPVGVELEADSIIDISHESLMRLWTRLVGWTKEEGRSTDIYSRLSRSARRHEAGEESLWRNPQLQIGLRWREENRPTAAWAGDEADFARSMRFLNRSRRAHQLRRAALTAAVLLVIAGLAWWVYLQRVENRRQQVENQRLAEEAVLLNEQIARLKREQQAEQVQVEEGAQEVLELRERNGQLKAGVAAAQKRREALNVNIKTLRESNKNDEQKIGVLNKENEALAQKHAGMVSEAKVLSIEQGILLDEGEDLKRQTYTLNVEQGQLTKEEESARARSAGLFEKAMWLGYIPSPMVLAPAIKEYPPLTFDEMIANIFNVPRDIADNDALRRQIEELQRMLDQLRAARLRQVDEARWLKRENELLELQLSALLKEVQGLERVESQLAARGRELRRLAAAAEKQNREFRLAVTQFEADNVKRRDEVEGLRKANEAMRKQNSEIVHDINSLRLSINGHDKNIRFLTKFITEALNRLVKPGPQVSADAAGLQAVAAFRLAPFDPEDPAQPSVYNALWLALNRLDEKALGELIKPSANGKGKIGTTTSEVLARKICDRVKRGFTEDEWRLFFPQQDYREPNRQSPLGDPCTPPGAGR